MLLMASNVYGGVDFDGSDDLLNCGNIDIITDGARNRITIAAWVKLSSGSTGWVMNKNFGGGAVPYSLNVGISGAPTSIDGIAFFNSGAWKNSNTSTDVRDGTWHHVAGVFDGTNLIYYVDGVSDSSTTEGSGIAMSSNSENTSIGRYVNDSETATGEIGDIALWNQALTVGEIGLLASSRIKRMPLQLKKAEGGAVGELQAYWPLDDQPDAVSGDGKTFMDLSGNGNHCTGDDGANNTGLTGKAEEALSYP